MPEGRDASDTKVADTPNPQIGPFCVDSAEPVCRGSGVPTREGRGEAMRFGRDHAGSARSDQDRDDHQLLYHLPGRESTRSCLSTKERWFLQRKVSPDRDKPAIAVA